jgi:4-hydroxy-3-methylbut-2-enyl diphosphate reductase
MDVQIATTGMCFGIERAYKMIERLVEKTPGLHAGHKCSGQHKNAEWDTLYRIERGDPELLKRYPGLAKLNIVHDDSEVGEGDELAIGYHGYEPERMQDLEARGVKLHDYMCPFIARMHNTAEKLATDGYDVIAFGKPLNHHTTYCQRAAERAGRVGIIAEDLASIADELANPERNWACVGQVTGNVAKWTVFSEGLVARGIPVHLVDTVCSDSHDRQGEAQKLAGQADVVVLVDDGGGASVSVLEAVQLVNPRVFRTGTGMPLQREWFEGVSSVAVVGGIMVPDWTLQEIGTKIRQLGEAAGMAGRS